MIIFRALISAAKFDEAEELHDLGFLSFSKTSTLTSGSATARPAVGPTTGT